MSSGIVRWIRSDRSLSSTATCWPKPPPKQGGGLNIRQESVSTIHPSSCYLFIVQLSDESLEEFIVLYKEETGEELTIPEAREIVSRLVTLYVLLARPLPSERAKEE